MQSRPSSSLTTRFHRGLVAFIASVAATSVLAGPFTEPFGDANQFSLIVSGNANLGSGVHVHGAGYIGGNLTVNGSNGSFGSAVPSGSLGLVVGGNVTGTGGGSKQIGLFNKSYFVGGSTSNIFWQNPGANLPSNPLAPDTTTSIAAALGAKSTELASLSSIGATINATDLNNVKFNLTAGALNVLNLNASNASFLSNQNTCILFENFTDTTKVIINVDLGAGLTFRAKNQNLASNLFDNVVWNFTGASPLTFANTVSTFKGTILAANSDVNWQANDIDGQLIAKNLTWSQTSQSHFYAPWEDAPPVSAPEPSSLLLLGPALLLLLRRNLKA